MQFHPIDRIRGGAFVAPAEIPADIDIDDLILRARRARDRYLGEMLVRGLAGLRSRWRRAAERRSAYITLTGMTDYELHDIGLTRGQIRAAVYGPPRPRFAVVKRLAAALARRLAAWRRRRQARLDFERLDDHILRDIGVTRQALGATRISAAGNRAVVLNVNEPLSAA